MIELISHRDKLAGLLNDLGLTNSGCEVGVYEAEYATTLLTNWRGKLLYLVDPWRNMSDYLDSWNGTDIEMQRRHDLALARLAPFAGRYRILRMVSSEAADLMPDASLDFVYIDANHGYAHVRSDLQLWYSKIRTGGLMAGHDYYDALADESLDPRMGTSGPKELLTSYGVKSAVDEVVAALGITVRATNEPYPTWYFQKSS